MSDRGILVPPLWWCLYCRRSNEQWRKKCRWCLRKRVRSCDLDFDFRAFDKFVENMRVRLIKGERKYRGAWRRRDLKRDIVEELLDIANYAFLEACKIEVMRNGRS